MKHKHITLNLGTLIALCVVFYMAYYLLLNDNPLRISLTAIMANSHQLSMPQHLLLLGLIPFYIAVVIFGAATIGIYFGGILQQFLLSLKTK